MTIEEMLAEKKRRGLSYKDLSVETGIPVPTLQKILTGETKNPKGMTLFRLECVLERPRSVSESIASGISNEYYTVMDLEKLPSEKRFELYHGQAVAMASPTVHHQEIAGAVCRALADYIDEKGGSCKSFMAPLDVCLCEDTVIQPDVFVLCDRSKYNCRRIMGAPDLVIEVTSPSTRVRDFFTKMNLCREHGCKEYWIIDETEEKVHVYDFTKEDFSVSTYTFKDKVPVAIYGKECKIDFKKIKDSLW